MIEALGFGALAPFQPGQGDLGRDWLAGLGAAMVQEDIARFGDPTIRCSAGRSPGP